MKKFLLAGLAALTFTACSTIQPKPLVYVGVVERTVERVIERHDAYAEADEDVDALMETFTYHALMDGQSLMDPYAAELLGPIMDRHDDYIRGDAVYNEEGRDVERLILLGDTSRLRSLLAEVYGDKS